MKEIIGYVIAGLSALTAILNIILLIVYLVFSTKAKRAAKHLAKQQKLEADQREKEMFEEFKKQLKASKSGGSK